MRPLLAAVALIALAPAGFAQAWLTPRGEGAVSLSHQYLYSDNHVNRYGEGSTLLGEEEIHALELGGGYGLTDRLQIDGTLLWVATKWSGNAQDRHGPLDTGTFHATVQDVRIALRYQLVEGPVAIAPFITYGTPTQSYETRGHSAFGRGLQEISMGADAGAPLGRAAYWQASTSYAFADRVRGVDLNLDRTQGSLEFGLTLGRRVSLRAFGRGQHMSGGLELGPQTDHLEHREIHDRLARATFINAGAGAGVVISRDLELSVDAYSTVYARNTHAFTGVMTSLTWRFGHDFDLLPARSP